MSESSQLNFAEFQELTTREILDHLPPIDAVPVLGHLARLGFNRFYEEYTTPAPVDEDGLVDHNKLVDIVKSHAVPGYRWAAPFFDIDHIYWAESKYIFPQRRNFIAELNYDSVETEIINTRRKFHDMDVNKIGVARQFHNLKELIVREPDIPDMDIMRRELKKDRQRQHLFQYASGAVTIREKLDRAQPVLLNGKVELIDKKDRRVYYNPDAMEERRENFIRRLLAHHARGLIDLTELAPLEVIDTESVQEALPEIATKIIDDGMVMIHNQRVRRVDIPTYVPSKQAA